MYIFNGCELCCELPPNVQYKIKKLKKCYERKGQNGKPVAHGKLLQPSSNKSELQDVLNRMVDDEVRITVQKDNRILNFGTKPFRKHCHTQVWYICVTANKRSWSFSTATA